MNASSADAATGKPPGRWSGRVAAFVVAAASIYLVVIVSSHFGDVVGFFRGRTPRELLLMTTLPIPETVADGRRYEDDSFDSSTAWAIARLDSASCQAALRAAPRIGYLPLGPADQMAIGDSAHRLYQSVVRMPDDNGEPAGKHRDPLPEHGFYWAHDNGVSGQLSHNDFSWIDSDDCRVFFMYESGLH